MKSLSEEDRKPLKSVEFSDEKTCETRRKTFFGIPLARPGFAG
ncbi:hypothetical protein [Marinobacter vulgaris]|nr:hypothetical protein [Marinobacter vulgaris]